MTFGMILGETPTLPPYQSSRVYRMLEPADHLEPGSVADDVYEHLLENPGAILKQSDIADMFAIQPEEVPIKMRHAIAAGLIASETVLAPKKGRPGVYRYRLHGTPATAGYQSRPGTLAHLVEQFLRENLTVKELNAKEIATMFDHQQRGVGGSLRRAIENGKLKVDWERGNAQAVRRYSLGGK